MPLPLPLHLPEPNLQPQADGAVYGEGVQMVHAGEEEEGNGAADDGEQQQGQDIMQQQQDEQQQQQQQGGEVDMLSPQYQQLPAQ